MKILILDDQSCRVPHIITRIFEQPDPPTNFSIRWVATVEQFRAAMIEQYDAIFLDHDLGDVENGYHAATYLAESVSPSIWPRNVFVHSFNPTGAANMINYLRRCGVSVWRFYL